MAAPVAAFSADVTVGEYPLAVQFTDESTGVPTAFTWDFGDNTAVSHEQNPLHNFTARGFDATVTLTVTNADGTDSETKVGYIHTDRAPQVTFYALPVDGDYNWSRNAEDTQVLIDNELRSGPAALSLFFVAWLPGAMGEPWWESAWDLIEWDLGDGTIVSGDPKTDDALYEFVHTYENAGTYTVTVTVSNHVGTDTETKTDYITVEERSPRSVFQVIGGGRR
jgi:PKD repeat protein